MASQKKIIECIGAIKTIYSYYAKETDVKLLVQTWSLLLQDYPDEVVERAFFTALKRCKMPPTPADVIEIIGEAQKALEPSDEELWSIYHDALRQVLRLTGMFGYTYIDETGLSQGEQARKKVTEIWNGLPEKIRIYLATEGELIRRARELNFTEISFEKTRFFKTMPIVAKRQEHSRLLLTTDGNNMLMIEGE